jgi:hypothetical protein
MNTAILLISDQALPNILFIKQFGPFDSYLLLTTNRMEREKRTDFIEQAMALDNCPVSKIEVDSENLLSIHKKLAEFPFPPNDNYTLNLTGGTKMMALAAYAFFLKLKARIVYLPINATGFLQIAPKELQIPIDVKVSLEEYLSAYGVVLQEKNDRWINKIQAAEKVMQVVRKTYKGRDAEAIAGWLTSQGKNNLPPAEKKFYAGEWFEVWLAQRITKLLNLDKDQIWVGAKLNTQNVEKNITYEYDLVFMYRNVLYTCECKYYNRDVVSYNKLREPLFKYASVVNQFGLNAKSFFAIANPITDEKVKSEIRDRCRLLRLPFPADIHTLSDDDKLKDYLKLK